MRSNSLNSNNVNPHTNPNLLNNWYFVYGKTINNDYNSSGTFPINQRGQQQYVGPGYSIDRWLSYNGTTTIATIRTSGIELNAGNTVGDFYQFIDGIDYAYNKIVTFSCIVDGELYTKTFVLSTSATTVPLSFGTCFIGIQDSGLTRVYFFITSNHNHILSAVKLELGSIQTLAHQENNVWVLNEIPNYDEELLKCMGDTTDINDTYSNFNGVSIKNAINTEITNRTNSDLTLQRTPSYLLKKFIFIGDSYMGQGLGTQIINRLPGINAKIVTAGGGGFAGTSGTYTFLTGLQNLASTMTTDEKRSITDIYVLGGYNDYSFTIEAIGNAIGTFNTYVRSVFPNAIITVGVIAFSNRGTDLALIERTVMRAYSFYGSTYGWGYIDHANAPIHYPDAMQSDGVHPITTDVIAKYIVQYIISKTSYFNTELRYSMVPYNNTAQSGALVLTTNIINNLCTLTTSGSGFIFADPFSFAGNLAAANRTAIGTYKGAMRGIEQEGVPTISVNIPVEGVWINNASFEDCIGVLWLSYGYIYLSIKRHTGQDQSGFTSSSFAIPPFSITAPLDLC